MTKDEAGDLLAKLLSRHVAAAHWQACVNRHGGADDCTRADVESRASAAADEASKLFDEVVRALVRTGAESQGEKQGAT